VIDHGEACAVMAPCYAGNYAPTVTDRPKTLTGILGVEHDPGVGMLPAWNLKRRMGVEY